MQYASAMRENEQRALVGLQLASSAINREKQSVSIIYNRAVVHGIQ